MKLTTWTSVFASLALLCACGGGNEAAVSLDNCPQVATFEQVGSNQVMVAHLDQLNDTIDMPLSALIEDLRIIPLDNRDEALTKLGSVTISPNYLIVRASQQAVKLYDKSGNFIGDVGSFGQGPGEYQLLYDEQIDEENNRIYLLPWNAKALLAYDLKGNFVQSIPLPIIAPKGVFQVDTKAQRVVVGVLPFQADDEAKPFVWQQDFEGNVLHQIDAKPYSVVPDFSNEVSNDNNVPGVFDFSILYWQPRSDTLYHYAPDSKQFMPVFTFQQPSEPVQHSYKELPNYYLLNVTTQIDRNEFGFQSTGFANVLIDKETGKGAYVRVTDDLLNNAPMPYFNFSLYNGHYIACYDPGDLIEIVEDALVKPENLKPEQKANLETLQSQLDDNDNTYLFIGKLRQNKAQTPTTVTILPRKEAVKHEVKEEAKVKVEKEKSEENKVEENDEEMPYTTAILKDWKNYFQQNNQYKDWPKDDEKKTMILAVIEADGTATDVKVARSSGIDKLDKEAIRLIENAEIEPATNEEGNPIRMKNWIIPVYFPPR